jgi:hypothetical protein
MTEGIKSVLKINKAILLRLARLGGIPPTCSPRDPLYVTIQRFLTVFFFPGTFQMELEDSPTKEGEKSNWLTLLAKN